MTWIDDFLPLAKWALHSQDLRHQYLYAVDASKVTATPGIDWTFEATVILAIYEAALGKGYRENETIGYEKAYPHSSAHKRRGNPKRADLAFKDSGQGKNWCYIEVKKYGASGKYWVKHDIDKLRSIKQKSQRWMFVYRVRKNGSKSPCLDVLLSRNFKSDLNVHAPLSFPTIANEESESGVCEFCLAKVL